MSIEKDNEDLAKLYTEAVSIDWERAYYEEYGELPESDEQLQEFINSQTPGLDATEDEPFRFEDAEDFDSWRNNMSTLDVTDIDVGEVFPGYSFEGIVKVTDGLSSQPENVVIVSGEVYRGDKTYDMSKFEDKTKEKLASVIAGQMWSEEDAEGEPNQDPIDGEGGYETHGRPDSVSTEPTDEERIEFARKYAGLGYSEEEYFKSGKLVRTR